MNVHSSRLAEDISMNVQHEVATARVLSDETDVLWSLEASVQVDEKWMTRVCCAFEHASLYHQAETEDEIIASSVLK